MKEILQVKDLSISFDTPYGQVHAVRNVSFSLKKGEILALVGESGCGKSVLCKSMMKLLPKTAHITSGSVEINGQEMLNKTEKEMTQERGKLFSMIFQDPMTSLNPTMTIGSQIAEAIRIHHKDLSSKEVQKKVIDLMTLVGIDRAEERGKLYPYNFSGGMRQRVVIAIAIACNPLILFADEPTTALDVTMQTQILDILSEIKERNQMSMILVTHDLGIAARVADRVAVMYAGKIVEIGTTEEIFYDARHPYTWGLMRALPSFAKSGEDLYTIPGMPPTLVNPPAYDIFAPRNEYALAIDYEKEPPLFQVSETHFAATWLLDERAPKIESPIRGIIHE